MTRSMAVWPRSGKRSGCGSRRGRGCCRAPSAGAGSHVEPTPERDLARLSPTHRASWSSTLIDDAFTTFCDERKQEIHGGSTSRRSSGCRRLQEREFHPQRPLKQCARRNPYARTIAHLLYRHFLVALRRVFETGNDLPGQPGTHGLRADGLHAGSQTEHERNGVFVRKTGPPV
jgi:hypothetical protein